MKENYVVMDVVAELYLEIIAEEYFWGCIDNATRISVDEADMIYYTLCPKTVYKTHRTEEFVVLNRELKCFLDEYSKWTQDYDDAWKFKKFNEAQMEAHRASCYAIRKVQ